MYRVKQYEYLKIYQNSNNQGKSLNKSLNTTLEITMVNKKVFCPDCREQFELKKKTSDGDLVTCPKCKIQLEVVEKRKNRFDVTMLRHEEEKVDLDDAEWASYD